MPDNSLALHSALEWIIPTQCAYASGAYYNLFDHCLWWTDSRNSAHYQLDLHTFSVTHSLLPRPFLWLKKTLSGQVVGADPNQVYLLDNEHTEASPFFTLNEHAPARQISPATVTPAGQLYVATSHRRGSFQQRTVCGVQPGQTSRYQEPGQQLHGLASRAAGDVLFASDFDQRKIYQYLLHQDGQIVGRQPFVTLSDKLGAPSGLAVDADGHVWVACWGSGLVCEFCPNGSLLQQIGLPATQLTSISFTGPGSSFLVVTSARLGLELEELHQQPHSGATFILDVGNKGYCEPPAQLM